MSMNPLGRRAIRAMSLLLAQSRGLQDADALLLERFVRQNDEAAFGQLVQRHGPMVLGVCRRMLADANLADDAFQATFLLLIQKAGSLRQPERLAGWLHGVACKIASRTRQRHQMEQSHLRRLRPCCPDETDREALAILDEELAQLPEPYRLALVKCYLNGLPHVEVARQHGWSSGSMSWKLGKAKNVLRERLVRRGVVLGTPALALLLESLSPSPVSAELLRQAMLLAPSGAAASAAAMRLTVGISMPLSGWTSGASLAVLAGGLVLLATGVGWATYSTQPQSPAPLAPAQPAIKPVPPPDLPAGASVRLGRPTFAKQQPESRYLASRFVEDGKVLEGITELGAIERWEYPSGRPLGWTQRIPLPLEPGQGGALGCAGGRFVRKAQHDGVEVFSLDDGRQLCWIDTQETTAALYHYVLVQEGRLLVQVLGTLQTPRSEEPEKDYAGVGLCLFDTATGQRVGQMTIGARTSRVWPVAGGEKLVLASARNRRQQWELVDLKELTFRQLALPEGLQPLDWHPRRPLALLRDENQHVLWNWQTGEQKVLELPFKEERTTASGFSGDFLKLRAGITYSQFFCNLASLEAIVVTAPSHHELSCAGTTPDGKLLLSAVNAGFMVADINGLKESQLGAVHSLEFNHKSDRLLVVNWNGAALWDVITNRQLMNWSRQHHMRFSRTSRYLTNGGYQTQDLIDAETFERRKVVDFPLDKNYGPPELLAEMNVRLRRGDKLGSGFCLIESPSCTTGAPEETRIVQFRIPEEDIRPWFLRSFDSGFNWALLTKLDRGRDGIRPVSELMLVDIQANRVRARWPLSGHWTERRVLAEFSPSGQHYALAFPSRLEIRHTATNKVFRSFPLQEAATALAFSPDGQRLATGMINGTVLLWDDLPR